MIAYHGDPQIKALYLAQVRAHREADQLIHGQYWERGKGCAVGCTVHSSDHATYETALGIPRLLARLEDGIFEALAPPHDLAWPEAFLEAIPVGADLSMIWPQFALALLADAEHGVLRHVQDAKHGKQRTAIEKVVAYYQQWVDAQEKPAAAAAAAYDATAAAATAYAAYAADAAAAVAATAAYDASAAYAASTAYAAYAAAYAAADAATAADAKKQARLWQSETLLQLLRHAPVAVLVGAAGKE